MKNATLLGLTAATATLFTACLFSGESGGPGRASVNLEIKASASTSAAALAKASGLILGDTAGVHMELSDAKLVVSRIKLESESAEDGCPAGALKKDGVDSSGEGTAGDESVRGDSSRQETEDERECEEENHLALKGPFVIDLLTGASTPDLGSLSVPPGSYDKVKIEMHHGQNDSTLGGRTLVAHGNLILADGSSKPFSLSLSFDENLEIESKTGLVLDADALNTVAVNLMAGDWLKGIDLAGCLGAIDPSAPSVDISEESLLGKCLDAEHLIKDNFRASFQAEEKDEDGKEGTDDRDSTEHSGEGK